MRAFWDRHGGKLPSIHPSLQQFITSRLSSRSQTLHLAIMKFISNLLLLVAPLALALPTSVITKDAAAVEEAIETRQSCYVKCGSTCYTSAQVTTARNAGYNYYTQGNEAGSSNYPHTYNNYEGFDFLVSGPYQEFPLRTSGAYTGGKLRWKGCHDLWL